MKKNFILGFFALGAMLLGACTTDDTADIKKKPVLSGEMRTVTIATDMTRTALNGHVLSWAAGDTFGIFAIDADGSGLSHFESPAYEEGKSTYEIEIPAETAALYCYYPYDRTNDETDFSSLYIEMDTWNANGKFNPTYFPMYAKAKLSADDTIELTFKPLVALLEFNIYDSKGDGTDLLYNVTLQLPEEAEEGCVGALYVDFSGDDVSVSGATINYLMATIEDDIEIGTTKDEGAKAYLVVAKRKYEDFYIGIDTQNHPMNWSTSTNGYRFDYTSLDLTNTLGGRTINIDLSNAPAAPMIDLDIFKKAMATGPWSASAHVEMADNCVKYVIAAFPSISTPDGVDDNTKLPVTKGDGWDEIGAVGESGTSKFEDVAEISIDTYTSKSGQLSYMVYTQSQTIYQDYFMYNDFDNNGEWNTPMGLRISDKVEEYTIAVYAVADDGSHEVYTTTFKPLAFSMGNGSVTPTVASTKNAIDSATATITAENADYIFYGYSNTLSGAPTEAQVRAMFENIEMDTYYAKYSGPVTLDFMKYGTKPYIVWAVAIDSTGAISSVASQTFEPVADKDLEFGGTARATEFADTFSVVKDWADYEQVVNGVKETVKCLDGTLTASIKFNEDIKAFAIWDMSNTIWNADDGSGTGKTFGQSVNLEYIKSELSALIKSGDSNSAFGIYFTKDDIKDGSISFHYSKYEDEHHLFAIALGNDDKLGPLVALAMPSVYYEGAANTGTWDVMQYATWQFYGNASDPETGGGDEEVNYWKQNLTGNYLDWLEFTNYTRWDFYYRNWDADITWKTNADGYENVKYVYVNFVTIERGAYSDNAVIEAVKSNFVNYDPADPDKSVSGLFISQGWGANAVKHWSPNPPQPWEGETAMAFTQKNSGGTVFVTILVDKDGYLTMKTAAYLTGEEDSDGKVTSATPVYVDLTNLVEVE